MKANWSIMHPLARPRHGPGQTREGACHAGHTPSRFTVAASGVLAAHRERPGTGPDDSRHLQVVRHRSGCRDVPEVRRERLLVHPDAIGVGVDAEAAVQFRGLSEQLESQYAQERLLAGVATVVALQPFFHDASGVLRDAFIDGSGTGPDLVLILATRLLSSGRGRGASGPKAERS